MCNNPQWNCALVKAFLRACVSKPGFGRSLKRSRASMQEPIWWQKPSKSQVSSKSSAPFSLNHRVDGTTFWRPQRLLQCLSFFPALQLRSVAVFWALGRNMGGFFILRMLFWLLSLSRTNPRWGEGARTVFDVFEFLCNGAWLGSRLFEG